MEHRELIATLRSRRPPIIARTREHRTILDLRSVHPDDDPHLIAALGDLA